MSYGAQNYIWSSSAGTMVPVAQPSMASRILSTFGEKAKTGAQVAAVGASNVASVGVRSISALRPHSAWELGAVVGGVAGVLAAVAFNLPTDTALIVVLIAAVAGAVIVGFAVPAAKLAPLLALF